MEKFLEKYITEDDIKERKVFMKVEFWEHHEGCSPTNFHCTGKTWTNPEDERSWYYKDIKLIDINEEVCNHITKKLIDNMEVLGFNLLSKEKSKSRFDYYHMNFYFGW